MPDPKILDYIKTEQQKGFAKATITTALLKIGWPQPQIDEAFASLNNQTPAAPVNQTPKQTPSQSSNYLPGVKQLFGQAWQIEKNRFKTIGAIMLFPFAFLVIGLIVGLIGIFAKQNLIAIAVVGIAVLFTIVFNICAPIALILTIKYRNEKIGFRQAYTKSVGKAIPLIILSILSGLISLTGLILFIVPAFIFGIWFSMAIYALVSDDAGIIASLKLSKQYVNGKFFAVLYRFIGFSIIIFLLSLLIGLIPVVNLFLAIINLLLFSPLSTIYSYLLYENLKNLNGKPISNQPSKLFVSLILFLLALIAFLLLVVLAYVVPNLIKNYGKPPTSYTNPSTQNYNPTATNTFSTPSPQPKTSLTTQTISDCESSTYEKIRSSNQSQIENAIIAYEKSHGAIPKNIPPVKSPLKEISSDGADICSDLVPAYLSALPEDPCINNGVSITNCSTHYDTGYEVGLVKMGIITAFDVEWASPEIRSENSTNNQLSTPTPEQTSNSALTPACTIDWSNFPPLIITGQPYTFSVTFNSNFGTAMPSVYIYPSGQALYRGSNSSGSNLNSVTVIVNLTGPANGTYTLKPYLDNSSAQGVECNEKTFTVGEQNLPSPTP